MIRIRQAGLAAEHGSHPGALRRARLVPVVLAFVWAVLQPSPSTANVYQYDFGSTAATIADPLNDVAGNCPASAASHDETLTVPASETFSVLHIALGLNVTHDTRSDLRIEIFRPGALNPFVVVAGNSGNGEDNDNYDVLFSSNSDASAPGTAPLNDNDIDPVAAPFYNRLVTVAGMDFYTGTAAGLWRLRVCDVDSSGGSSTYNRARLILTDDVAAGSVCTGTRLTYNWGANGNQVDFSSATVGGVTINEVSTTNFGAGRNNGTYRNFQTDTDSLGGHDDFYSLYMDASTTGGATDDSEAIGQQVVFSFLIDGFSYSVQDLEFQTLDSDQANNDFEDVLRIEAAAVGGGYSRYARTPANGTPVFQDAGDTIEADTSCDNSQDCATETYKFDRAVSNVTLGYFAGDDTPVEPGDQVVGISDFQFCAFDFGDAPDSYGTTLAAGVLGGARHVLANRDLWMGNNRPDGESEADAASGVATGDDVAGASNDEDGITATFPACPNNGTYSVSVTASDVRTAGADGEIRGYIDWNRDGDFADANEISAARSVPRTDPNNTSYSVNWSSVPSNCGGTATTFARFRYSTDVTAVASPTGFAPNGEVEDYRITATTLPVTIARVEMVPAGRSLEVRFTTASEAGNAGFRIWGKGPQVRRTLLATVKSKGSDSFVPQTYEATVSRAGISSIEIEDVSLFGDNRVHGPFAVGSTMGEEPQADVIDWAAVRGEDGVVTQLDRMRSAEAAGAEGEDELGTMRATPVGTNGGLLLVREEGIHRVTHEQLLAAGINLAGVSAATIAVVDKGAGVPRHIEAAGGTFGAGSYIEFVARPQLTLASPVDAYVLTIDSRKVVAVNAAKQGPGGNATTWALDRYRPDQVYSFSSPNGDPWFDERALAWGGPATLSRTFDLPDLKSGSVRIKVRLWGYGNFDGTTPDHHVVLKLNGTEIAQRAFDGLTAWEPEIDITGLATASGNTLELVVPGDTGYAFDNIAFEGFELSYPRAALARNGRFQGTDERLASFSIGGFASEPVAMWKSSASRPTRQLLQPAGGAISALGGSGTVYAASQSQLLRPGIVAGIPAVKRYSTAEYLIVTHPAFKSAVAGLAALEESRGFTTEVITVDQIFATYSDHASSAAALKSFLSASLVTGNLRYVLLVGADTTDPYDHLGMGSISYVPTDFHDVSTIVRFSPTDESLVDRQSDGLGDIPIGRLPVRTTAELGAVVAKLYAWEATVGSGQPSALLVAGLSDGARSISSVNEAYGGSLGGWNGVLAQVDDSGSAAVRQQTLDAIDAGALLVSYVGHSSMGQWDQTPLLKWQDAANFTNAGLPNLITAWGCWNSYYVEPTIESLSARLLRQPNAGAAGTIGATTLTTEASHRLLGTLFFARVNAGAATVGEAFHGAKQDMMLQGGAVDAIYGMTLLGDPAMSLPQFQ